MWTTEMEHLEESITLLEDGLLQNEDSIHTGDGTVNIKGEVAIKSEGGTWKACPFLIIEGICTLTLSAIFSAQSAVFFLGIYLIAVGTGGIKPCIWPFGADQFDDTDHKERASKALFFNWNYFTSNIGALIATTILVWTEENIGWGLGYGIAASFIGIGMIVFFLGTRTYRFLRPGGSPITRICQVVVASLHKRKLEVPQDTSLLYETVAENSSVEGTAVKSDIEKGSEEVTKPWRLCTVTQVEELKILIRMIPIWATGIIFSSVYAQMSSLFIEQGKMMDRTIGSFTIPAASLSTFNIVGVIIWVLIYDRVIVKVARHFTGNARGFTVLQRMGIGLFLSMTCMSAAAILESKRLQIAREHGLVDEDVSIPLSILWQIPQYFLLGAAEVFNFIGQHEFFYEEAPDRMRSFCSALALLTNSLGNYLSSFVVTIVARLTRKDGSHGWLPDNLNEGHLDYFFWLLAALSFLNMLVYIVYARMYKQKTYCRNLSQRLN
ncbi:hypothetical protein Ahy_B03g061978 [Arachis hypogaea]|uniref:Protein NRT1/ PTR FAMILY 8.3 n=1 Tax=Arachis hypogaea TaxID=3818 RepID=A0A444ZSX8_ARAHY|nr:hypothetical protein Ahy_B03g061978 [Arachis hypogaea]